MIEQFIDRLLPEGWDDYTREERMDFWRGEMWDGSPAIGTEQRQTICAAEIHMECFGADPKTYTRALAREYNTILRQLPGWVPDRDNIRGPYGHQRGFRRA